MTNAEKERRTEEALKLSSLFEELDGRRPRLFMPELEDDDDKEARKLAATTFADHGWDVDVSPLLSPEISAQNAADNDVHFIFYTSKSPTMKQKLIALSQTLAMIGRDDILIAAHQVSKDDKELLFRYGILAAFDKNTDVSDVSLTMLRVLVSMAKEEQNPTEEMPY
jgi:methylmalonyl-coA mutase, alpha subunit